ncbi:hypothetical protein ACHAW6_012810 [Cyclotella cf. meneghiniana]
MKISILAIIYLSLINAQSPQRTRLQRRLRKDSEVNEMRNILLAVRDIDGTPISIGPEGATARMSMSMLGEVIMTTLPPQYDIPDEIMEVFHDPEDAGVITTATDIADATLPPVITVEADEQAGSDNMADKIETEMSILSKGSKSKPRQQHHHHDMMSVSPKAIKISTTNSHSESNGELGMSMPTKAKSNKHDISMGKSVDSKSDKFPESSMSFGEAGEVKAAGKTAKGNSSSLSMGKTEKSLVLSKESGSKATKESLSIPNVETKGHVHNLSMGYDGKSEKTTFSMDSKAKKETSSTLSDRGGKTGKVTLSMPGEAAMEDLADLSIRFGGKAEKILSMQSYAGKEEEEANEFWLEYDSKTVKSGVLSMDSKAAKSEVKAEKESLPMPSAKTLKEAINSMSIGYGKAEKTTFSIESKAEKSPVLSMDTKAAKRETNAEKESLSMPSAKALKEAVESLSLGYGKVEKTSFSMESKADKSPVLSMDAKAAKGVSKAEKETLSMPAAKTTKEGVISLSMGYGGKAEKALSMDSHPRLFSLRKRVQTRRLIESLSYSMSMDGEVATDFTDIAVEYTDDEDPVTIMANMETSGAAEEEPMSSGEISESNGEIIETIMSTNLKSKTSKTTLSEDPMAKAVKGDSLSLSPKSAKSTAPKAGKAKAEPFTSVNPKAEKHDHSLSMKGSGKAEKERDQSLSFSMKSKHALKHRLFDNRKEHIARKGDIEVR